MAEEVFECVKCGVSKAAPDFYTRMSRGKPYRRKDCKECEKLRASAWQQGNRERVREIDRDRYARNADKKKAYMRDRRASSPAEVRELDRRARIARRARKHAVLFLPPSDEALARKLESFGGRCAYCGVIPKALHWDHWKPISKGGPHILANLYPSCADCNQRKAARWPWVPPRRPVAEVS